MTSELAALPTPTNAEGAPRRVGVEIELGALDESRVTEILCETLGGEAEKVHGKGWKVKGSRLGDLQVYLDSRYLDDDDNRRLAQVLREVARNVVPVEIVTEPILPDQIAEFDEALDRLAAEGATGTAAGVLLGFGVHFNPEVTGSELSDILPVVTAFALLEDHLRHIAGIDLARRALPFVDPYPRNLVDALARGGLTSLEDLIDLYIKLAPSRNYALDMLCLFAHLDRQRVSRSIDMTSISPRPTYHFRLPDCRIDEPDWSLALEWNRWVLVERVANDPLLLNRLKRAWLEHRASLTTVRGDWAERSRELLMDGSVLCAR